MGWEIEFIRLLQGSSSAPADWFFFVITQLGTEIAFMAVAMLYYWCISKKEGYKLINLFMASQVLVGVIKVAVKRTRPYNTGKVEAIMERTDGYSFPSGHSNNIAVIGTHTSLYAKKSRFLGTTIATAVFVALLVMLSRLYLGQHYPTDVVTGAVIGCSVALIGSYIFALLGDREERIMYVAVPLCVILFAVAVYMKAAKGEAFDSVMKVAGTYMAATIGYFLEKRFVGYEVKADKKYKYVVRMALGAVVTLAIQQGLKYLFALTGELAELILDFVRYFLIGFFVTFLAPFIFKKLKI